MILFYIYYFTTTKITTTIVLPRSLWGNILFYKRILSMCFASLLASIEAQRAQKQQLSLATPPSSVPNSWP